MEYKSEKNPREKEKKIPRLTYRRRVRPSDCKRIHEILESTDFFSQEELEIADELVREGLKEGIRSGYYFFFAEQSGKIIGYTCFGPIPGTLQSYDLYWIVVHKDYHRIGLGKKLLAKTEDLIFRQGGRKIYIDTSSRDQYKPTRIFYKSCKYGQVAFLKDYYAPGDDKIIYVKDL